MQILILSFFFVSLIRGFIIRDVNVRDKLESNNGKSEMSAIQIVDYINRNELSFKAKLLPASTDSHKPMRRVLMNKEYIKLDIKDRVNEVNHKSIADDKVPTSFDSQIQWPKCASIKNIRDQSACGSCWAFGAAEAMSDRICITSNGINQSILSADDILSCCGKKCGDGCSGGFPLSAWQHWVKNGFVTGGSYNSKYGCRPYPFPPCEHHVNGTHYQPCQEELYPTPKCTKKCIDGYSSTYEKDLHYGNSAYTVSSKVSDIQKEIMTNGPVQVAFTVFEDFEHYSHGIYLHTIGKELGGHSVKMIGWGTEHGIPYWICSNSWNTDWGENGYFRIIRGINECGIEESVVAGIPKM